MSFKCLPIHRWICNSLLLVFFLKFPSTRDEIHLVERVKKTKKKLIQHGSKICCQFLSLEFYLAFCAYMPSELHFYSHPFGFDFSPFFWTDFFLWGNGFFHSNNCGIIQLKMISPRATQAEKWCCKFAFFCLFVSTARCDCVHWFARQFAVDGKHNTQCRRVNIYC